MYDTSGRLIKTLLDKEMPADSYNISWDGTDNNRASIASGVYFYRLQADTINETRRLVLMK